MVLRRDRAGGGSTSSRSAPSTPTARRPSTTTASRTTWASSPGRPRRPDARLGHVQPQPQEPLPPPRLAVSVRARTWRRRCRTSRRRTTSRSSTRCVGQRGRPRRALRPHVGRRSRAVSAEDSATDIADARRLALHASTPPRPSRSTRTTATRPTAPAATSCASLLGGTHDFKGGVQLSWERMAYDRIRNGDILLEMRDGVAFQGADRQHADRLGPQTGDLGRLRPGSLDDRSRHHQPRPPRRRRQRLPAGAVEPGRHLRAARGLPADRRLRLLARTSRRASASPTTSSATARPPSRPTTAASTTSSARKSSRPPTPTRLFDQNVVVDRSPTAIARSTPVNSARCRPSRAACSRSVDQRRQAALQRRDQRRASNISWCRTSRWASATTAASTATASVSSTGHGPPAAYTPEPHLHRLRERPGEEHHDLQAAAGVRHRARPLITNVDVLKSNYNGVTFDIQKRMSNRWQMLAGLGLQTHGASTTAARSPTRASTDFSNPNYVDQPRRRLGLHRPAMDLQSVGQLPAARMI